MKYHETHKEVAPSAVNPPAPEFVNYHGAKAIFGFSRSFLYRLMVEGKIKSVSLRKRGCQKGKRLFDCDSIRAYIRREMEGGQ